MLCVEKRGRFHRLLRVHAEQDDVEHQLHVGLRLVVAAGAADGHHRLAVLADDVVDQRSPGTLARLHHVGVSFLAVEHLDAGAEGAAQLREEHRLGESPAADGAAHHVTLLVHGRHVGRAIAGRGVRRGRVGCSGQPVATRAVAAAGLAGVPPRVAGLGLGRVGGLKVNQRARSAAYSLDSRPSMGMVEKSGSP